MSNYYLTVVVLCRYYNRIIILVSNSFVLRLPKMRRVINTINYRYFCSKYYYYVADAQSYIRRVAYAVVQVDRGLSFLLFLSLGPVATFFNGSGNRPSKSNSESPVPARTQSAATLRNPFPVCWRCTRACTHPIILSIDRSEAAAARFAVLLWASARKLNNTRIGVIRRNGSCYILYSARTWTCVHTLAQEWLQRFNKD